MLTSKEKHILKHSLGLNIKKVSYRNYFTASEDHDDYEVLENLRARGFMSRFKSRVCCDYIYHVTNKGKEIIGEKI